ncbi:cytochrome P450 monooxygenase [Melampsora americana]|nr:cytochrome P450 monooxygenase [Melampsora americana]
MLSYLHPQINEVISFHGFPSYVQMITFFLALWFVIEVKFAIIESRMRRRAVACGGRIAPLAHSSLPFGISMILDRLRIFNSGTVTDLQSLFGKGSGKTQRNQVIRTRCLGIDMIHIRSHLDIRHIFTNDKWGKSSDIAQALKYLIGEDSIITADQRGTWSWHRTLLRPHFARSRIADFNATEEHIARVIEWLDRKSEADEIVDFQDIAYRFTLTTGSQHFFGQSSTLNPERFSKYLEDGLRDCAIHAIMPSFLRKISQGLTMPNKAIKEIFKVIDRLVVDENQKDGQVNSEEVSEAENLVQHLKRSGCSSETVSFELCTILLAARDTTASLLTSCIFELAGRDELWSQLRSEAEYIPTFPDISLEELPKLKRLRAVINETLRIHTPGWQVFRHAFEDDVLPSGTFVPSGTDCALYLSETHRDPSVWGEDADEFVPDRWLDGRHINHAAFMPFTAGPRICIGQKFAMTEVTVALVRLLQSFTKVELVGPSLPKEGYQKTTGGVVTFRGGVWVKFHKC